MNWNLGLHRPDIIIVGTLGILLLVVIFYLWHFYLHQIYCRIRSSCLSDGCHRLADFLDAFRKDPEKARVVYEKNCTENKYGQSCYKLGNYSLTQKAGPMDSEAALKYFILGCDYGYAPACDNAGTLFLDEKRLGRYEPHMALPYIEKACKMEDVRSCEKLSELYIRGSKGIAQDMKKAFTFAQRSCDLGHYKGCANLSIMYKRGDGVDTDLSLSEKYKQQARKLYEEMTEVKRQMKFGQ